MKERTSDKRRGGYIPIKALGIVALALLILVSIAGAAPFAYITNENDNSVSIIDTATNAVIKTVSVGLCPHAAVVTPDGTKVYVSNMNGNSVSVIDTTTNTVIKTVPIGNWGNGIDITPDGKKVYVANGVSNSVSVIDTTTNTVIQTVPVGNDPCGVYVIADGSKVYVANAQGSSISVIDTANDTVTKMLPAGTNPWWAAVTPDGKKAYATNGQVNTVSVIDTTTGIITKVIGVGSAPCGIAISNDGKKMYVTNSGSNDVSVIDTVNDTVTKGVGVGSYPCGVAFTPDGTKVYVTNFHSNDVSVINTVTDTVLNDIYVGSGPVTGGKFIGPSVTPIPPVANFSSNVTEGNAPLDVQFIDLSKNANHLEWNFGDNSSNATDANPEHVFTSPGQFNVVLTASNSNGSSSKSMTINVRPPQPPNPVTLSFNPQTVGLQPGSSQNVQIVMNKVPASGLSGYNVTISVLDPAIANITAVSPPGWAGVSSTSTVPSGSVWITAVDTSGQVHPGDINVSLGNITITGEKNGTTKLIIVSTEMDDNNGDLMNPNLTNGTINVNQLVPFPGCINPPTDPNHDGLYEDINGNGRWDFADVVKYFNNMGWIPQNEPFTYFDYNHNGRIDFNDVVKLFNMQSS